MVGAATATTLRNPQLRKAHKKQSLRPLCLLLFSRTCYRHLVEPQSPYPTPPTSMSNSSPPLAPSTKKFTSFLKIKYSFCQVLKKTWFHRATSAKLRQLQSNCGVDDVHRKGGKTQIQLGINFLFNYLLSHPLGLYEALIFVVQCRNKAPRNSRFKCQVVTRRTLSVYWPSVPWLI